MASETRVRLLAAVADSKLVAVPVARLADRLGIARETAWHHLRDAQSAGEVHLWPGDPKGASVALTPLAASRLGKRICSESAKWLD